MQLPNDQELLTPNAATPITFRHGIFEVDGRSVVIDSVQIYPTAVLAGTTGPHTSTDDADEFLNQLISWASKTFGIQYLKIAEPAYSSQLEVKLARSLNDYFPSMKTVCEMASRMLPDIFSSKPPYEVAGITLSFDRLKYTPTPANVRIERRDSAPYSENLYFSEAPLTTKNHLVLLTALEETLRA